MSKQFPKNFIFRKPLLGALYYWLLCLGFVLLYMPLGAHSSMHLGYAATMAVYTFVASVAVLVASVGLGHLHFFSGTWTIAKEFVAIVLVLTVMGAAVYAIGFALEPSSNRLNLFTFANSFGRSFLIGLVPFALFTVLGRRVATPVTIDSDERITIQSQLKKEVLRIVPSQLLYAESDGNYINFYLLSAEGVKRHSIRNSISNVEQQLQSLPYMVRTHRAFIVNLNHVTGKQGNSAGYRLSVRGVDTEVPVSRQKVDSFDSLYNQFPS